METSLAQVRAAEPDSDPVPPFVERDFRQYLECGILAHGNALMQDLTPYSQDDPLFSVRLSAITTSSARNVKRSMRKGQARIFRAMFNEKI